MILMGHYIDLARFGALLLFTLPLAMSLRGLASRKIRDRRRAAKLARVRIPALPGHEVAS